MEVFELKQQVNDILNFFDNKRRDKGFVDMCERNMQKFINSNCYNASDFYRIASIPVDWASGVSRDVESDTFTSAEILSDAYKFYEYIDSLYDGGFNLENKVRENVKNGYLDIVEKNDPRLIRDPGFRANCGSSIDENGNFHGHITLSNNGEFEDRASIAHEFCHSLSKIFSDSKHPKDERMRELCTTIVDYLYLDWLAQERPELKDKAYHSYIAHRIRNIEKARKCIREDSLCKAICGKVPMSEVMQSIPKLFKEYNLPDHEIVGGASRDRLQFFNNAIRDIKFDEKNGVNKFIPYYESRYVQNTIIANEFLNVFNEKNGTPEEQSHKADCIKRFKEVLSMDHECTQEEAVEKLGLRPLSQLTDDWCKNFNAENNKYMAKMNNKKSPIK